MESSNLATKNLAPGDRSQAAPIAGDRPGWQTVLAEAVRDAGELCRLLDLPESLATEAAGDFPLLVPRPYLARIRRGDPQDPLLLQVLPQRDENRGAEGFCRDPLGEAADASHGVLSKYEGRVLIVASPACAVHCRFCFRRHFPYSTGPPTAEGWQAAMRRVERDASIHEVILSGGDPLMMEDAVLESCISSLAAVPHVRRVRLHTRLPVVIPQRVTEGLVRALRGTRLSAIVAVHVDHPREIDDEVAAAFARLVDAGIPVLSQGVLLRGVNDDADVLAELYERLVDLRVTPYYLHQLDRVAGAAHFEVPEATGIRLIEQLRARLPGYAVPRYVREVPGQSNKVPLLESTL